METGAACLMAGLQEVELAAEASACAANRVAGFSGCASSSSSTGMPPTETSASRYPALAASKSLQNAVQDQSTYL